MSVRVSDITVRKEHLRILALNDINNELDEKEIDSWIRLTRVLTHEIMNAVTPITSLSDTLLGLTEAQVSKEEIRNGLQTISSTGKGLLSFVESYRKFTRIPTPEPSLFYVKSFIERMVELARHHMALHAAGDFGCGLLKGGERFGRGTVQHHANHHQHARPHALGVEQRYHSLNQPQPLEPLHAPQAGGRAQMHLLGQRHVGQRSIALQLPQDGFVGAVQLCRHIDGRRILATNFCCTHSSFFKILID